MPRDRPPNPSESRQQRIALVRSGRAARDPTQAFEPAARTIVNRAGQAGPVVRACRLLVVTIVSLIALCGAPATASGDTADEVPSAGTWETLLAEARARERQCGGDTFAAGPPLTWNDRLGAAAQAHSEDMAQVGQLSHEGSEGETLADRLGTAGYRASAWGENVASGQPDATAVVTAWLDSPGHCANIMSADYTEFGVGVDRDPGGTPYWTLVLAAPRD